MKKYLFLLCTSISSGVLFAQPTGIRFFKGTWAQALEKAKQESKVIFLDGYSNWCAPCKYLEKKVFTQPAVGDYFNNNFISVSINTKEGEGITVADKYKIQSLPALLFINERGYKIEHKTGKIEADALLEWAHSVTGRVGSISFEERFDNGERTDSFIHAYTAALIKERRFSRIDTLMNRIIQDSGYNILYKRAYLEILPVTNIDWPAAIYFVENRQRFAKKYTEDTIAEKIQQLYVSNVQLVKLYRTLPPHNLDEKAYNNYLGKMKDRNLPYPDQLLAAVDFYVQCRAGKVEQAFALAEKALGNGKPFHYRLMAQLANSLYFQEPYKIIVAQWAAKGR